MHIHIYTYIHIYIYKYVGQVTKTRPSCHPALLSIDSKTRQQDDLSFVTRPTHKIHKNI